MIRRCYILFMLCMLLWPGRANRGKRTTQKWRKRRGSWLFWGSKVVAPPVPIKEHVILAPMVPSFNLYWPHVGYMGPGKPNSTATTLSSRPSLLWGGLLEGEWGSLGWRLGRTIAGGQDIIFGAGAQIWLSRDFIDGCHTWDLWGSHVWRVGQVLPL
jgi:hypothetical protein